MIPAPLLALIRRFEGCKLKAYLCPARVWTIGWGATGPEVTPGTVWTQAQADTRLEGDATVFAAAVARVSPGLLVEPEARHAAIADFAYNLGTTAYKASSLRRAIDRQDWEEAARQIQRWVFGGGRRLPGLVIRRGAEADLLIQGKTP